MKKIMLLLITAALVIGLNSCSGVQTLTEADAAEVIGVLTTATAGSIYSPDSRTTGDALAKAISANFNKTQTDGGTASFTFKAEPATVPGDDQLTGIRSYFDVTFTDFKVTVTNDTGVDIAYTLNGTMYMEYKLDISSGLNFSFKLYTDAGDTLAIDGGGLSTPLELNVTNTLSIAGSSVGGSMSYSMNGTCNGYTFQDTNGQITAAI